MVVFHGLLLQLADEHLGRSATTDGQQLPVHWGGDSTATFESMTESLRSGLSLSLSGFGFWSHDRGGFEQTASPDIYKRWCAFGLSSHSRLHGSQSYRVPWLFDEESVDVLRFFTKLKCRLMPYFFGAACKAHEAGVLVMWAMLLEFPDDPACDALDRQYMLGEWLLVAPIFTPDGTVDYCLPAGCWTHFLTDQVVEGGRWLREKHDFLSLPLLVRPNSIIAVGSQAERPDYDYSGGVTLQVYELADGAAVSATISSLTGEVAATFALSREDCTITVERQGTARQWQILLAGIEGVDSVEGGPAESSARGVLVRQTGSKLRYSSRMVCSNATMAWPDVQRSGYMPLQRPRFTDGASQSFSHCLVIYPPPHLSMAESTRQQSQSSRVV